MNMLGKFFGNIGERYAEKYLKRCGYTIIERQHNAGFVEIDILARRGKTLAIFEVKSVSHRNTEHDPFHPRHRVTQTKRKKLATFAEYYLNEHPTTYTEIAIGIIIVSLQEILRHPHIEVIWI